MKASQPIGVFDSGLGGLTILKALKKYLPNEQFIYYGDTAHLPYGEKSSEALQSYVTDISQFLAAKGCKMMVVACNSASTVLDEQLKLPFKEAQIVNVIQPIIDLMGNQDRFRRIAIIGTRKTIDSEIFHKGIQRQNPSLDLISRKTPLLVPMIEEGFFDQEALFPIFDRYFNDFGETELIIPACTHYPIIYDQIEAYFDHKLKVLHTPKIIAEEVLEKLKEQGLLNTAEDRAPDEYHLSDVTDTFKNEARLFLGEVITFRKTLLNS